VSRSELGIISMKTGVIRFFPKLKTTVVVCMDGCPVAEFIARGVNLIPGW